MTAEQEENVLDLDEILILETRIKLKSINQSPMLGNQRKIPTYVLFSNGSPLPMSSFAFSQFPSLSNSWPNLLDLLVWTCRLRKKEATMP